MMESQLVWAPNATDGYVLGRVVDLGSGNLATIQLEPDRKQQKSPKALKIECNINNVFPAEVDLNKNYDDNCSLMYLNEANLLHNLRLRYFENKIYTYVANILIALNPYENLKDKLYSSQVLRSYKGKSLGKMPPHVFAIADKAYNDMKRSSQSQSIIVSGESGAGKTESTKYVLRYLCESCCGSHAGDAIQIEQLILEANPLLEAFGNAKTARNNNSSRFGKFIEIFMDAKHTVAGGHISHYLLEKSRICGQISPSERNYHIFYQLCVGLSEDMWTKLKLGPPDKFGYLKRGCTRYFMTQKNNTQLSQKRMSRQHLSEGVLTDAIVNDIEEFNSMDQALEHFGVSKEDKFSIYQIVAAILHLGNIAFEESPDDSRGGCRVKLEPESQEALSNVSQLLGVDQDQLQTCLQTRVMQTNKGGHKGSIYMVPLKVYEAQNARDALAKAIYSRLFDYIVSKIINRALPLSRSNGVSSSNSSSHNSIGVLDIAGFEYFQTNSFEQFCINYCNEKLQNFFNERILNDEQNLYEAEGLGIKRIDYMNNSDCIELFEAKSKGIFDLLDEESRLPRSSVQHFTEAVHSTNRGNFRLDIPRKSKLKIHRELRDDEGFIVRHFAGAVCYQTSQFIEKNNDTLHTNLAFLMIDSNNKMMKNLFQPEGKASSSLITSSSIADKSVRLSAESVGGKFRKQLSVLIDKLESTGTHFVRCIKPNFSMVSKCFEGAGILSQLKCAGMTTVLQLMQHGYPSRATYNQIYDLYSPHLPPKLARYEPRFFCKALVYSVGLTEESDVRFGVTKVFFRPGRFAEFDMLLKNDDPVALNDLVVKVQKWLVACRWKRAQWGAYSVIKLKNKIRYRRKCIIVIEKNVRRFLVQKRYRPHFQSVKVIKQTKEHLNQIQPLIEKIQSKEDKTKFMQQLTLISQCIDRINQDCLVAKSDPPILNKAKVDKCIDDIGHQIDSLIGKLQTTLNEQEIRLKRVQEDMEAERRKKAEEEALKRRQDEIRLKKMELEEQRKLEVEKQAKLEEMESKEPTSLTSFYSLEILNAEDKQRQVDYLKRLEQEKRDYELALRLAKDGGAGSSMIQEDYQIKPETSETKVSNGSKKYNLESWNYAKLRDTINESIDIELLESCREELHRRLKVYHQWKYRNNRTKQSLVEVAEKSMVRAPESVINGFYKATEQFGKSILSHFTQQTGQQQQQPPQKKQRYFSLPLPSQGQWYAHFDGKWIARQMEIHPKKQPILLVSGRDDLQMCELSLEETGLTRKLGAEILPEMFEMEWKHNGGPPYTRTNN